ncbi:MAG: GxxExxY protein [Gemmatimonadaceae bacterium]
MAQMDNLKTQMGSGGLDVQCFGGGGMGREVDFCAMHDGDPLTYQIIGAAIDVSKGLGTGLLESVYQMCLHHELLRRGLTAQRHPLLPVVLKGQTLGKGFRPDVVVEKRVIVEVKAVPATLKAHEAQLLNYMRLSGIRTGLLINFHSFPFSKGITRFVI